MTNRAVSGPENVRMSALLKRGGRTDDRSDETSGAKEALTCDDRKRPDETSGQSSGQLLISPDVFGTTWPDRLAQLVAKAVQRQERKRAVRQEFAERREAGLRIRHQTKTHAERTNHAPTD